MNVFVSHIHEDDSQIQRLKDLMADRGLNIRDSSITNERPNNAKDPAYIKREILAPQIDWAGTLIVLLSPETRASEFVEWEIEYAAKKEKPPRIVGVYTSGSADCEVPSALVDYEDARVNWNGDAIYEAITGRDQFLNPDGSPRRERYVSRYDGC